MRLFAERMLHYRKERGLGQIALAKLLKMDQTGICDFETSFREPGLMQIEAIARALKVDYRKLIT